MDFVGDEDAVRYALEIAIHAHGRETAVAGVDWDSLPSADIARVFVQELAARGWEIRKRSSE